MPNQGDLAPDFTLKGTTGEGLALSSFKGKKRALLVFYPEDMTSGCTDQLSAIRDNIDDFRALDTEPFGVNEGDAASHQAFIDRLGLPFDLLIDEGLQVSDAYDALKVEGTIIKRKLQRINRTVIIVGKDGKIIFRAAGAPPPGELLGVIQDAKDS
jgi:peroxiredoxin Q/BCP